MPPLTAQDVIAKTQGVRLLDIFALGPLLVAAGASRGALPPAMRGALVASGVLTVSYNAARYRQQIEAPGTLVPGLAMGAQPALSLLIAGGAALWAMSRA